MSNDEIQLHPGGTDELSDDSSVDATASGGTGAVPKKQLPTSGGAGITTPSGAEDEEELKESRQAAGLAELDAVMQDLQPDEKIPSLESVDETAPSEGSITPLSSPKSAPTSPSSVTSAVSPATPTRERSQPTVPLTSPTTVADTTAPKIKTGDSLADLRARIMTGGAPNITSAAEPLPKGAIASTPSAPIVTSVMPSTAPAQNATPATMVEKEKNVVEDTAEATIVEEKVVEKKNTIPTPTTTLQPASPASSAAPKEAVPPLVEKKTPVAPPTIATFARQATAENTPVQKVAPVESTVVPQATESASNVGSYHTSPIRSIRTFRDDMTTAVSEQKTSLVSAIAAEQDKLSQQQMKGGGEERKSLLSPIAFYVLGVSTMLIVAGVAVFGYLSLTDKKQPVAAIQDLPAYIFTEAQQQVDATGDTRQSFMDKLMYAKSKVNVRLGAITYLYLTANGPSASGLSTLHLLSTAEFLNSIESRAPASLVRALDPTMMLGVHEFDGNQPFLIFKIIDYENAFAGMLAWEKDMNGDLAPLFGEHILHQVSSTPTPAPLAPTATDTVSTSTVGTTTGSTTEVSVPEEPVITTDSFLPIVFEDAVIRNKDVRVMRGDSGNIVLLYSFVDRSTLVVTTNEPTFVEVLTRLTSRRF